MMPVKSRVVYLDLLRIVACLCVIGIHVSAQNWHVTDVRSFEWNVMNGYDVIVRFGVPVLVMISGVFFLDPLKKITIKQIYAKYILRITVAYIFWSAFYAVFTFFLEGQPFSPAAIGTIMNSFLASHYHLWFLPMLIGLYMIIPVLRFITKNEGSRKILKYFLILFFVYEIIRWTVLQFDILPNYESLKSILTRVPIEWATGFVGYFILGYYIYHFPISKKRQNVSYVLGIIGLLTAILGSSVYSVQKGEPTVFFLENNFISTFLVSAGVFVLFKYKISKITFTERKIKMITNVSSYTFGIYLVHVFYLKSLNTFFNIQTLQFVSIPVHPLYSVPLLSILIFILSLFTAYLIKKIPFVHKYII